MKRIEASLPGLLLLESPVFRDERGSFQETYNQRALHGLGIDAAWCQDNLSVSAKGVLRGLHYQIVQPQAKLVRVAHGAVFDVAVDIRRSSPTFQQHYACELRAGDGRALYIPEGFAHGFVALEPETIFLYKVNDFHAPAGERTILWNDPELAIAWPRLAGEFVLSEKDKAGRSLAAADLFP